MSWKLQFQVYAKQWGDWIASFTRIDPNIDRAWLETLDEDENYREYDITQHFVLHRREYKVDHLSRVGVRYRVNGVIYTVYYTEGCVQFPPYPFDEIVLGAQIAKAVLCGNGPPIDVTRIVREFAGPRGDFYAHSLNKDTIESNLHHLVFPYIPDASYSVLHITDTFCQKKKFIFGDEP